MRTGSLLATLGLLGMLILAGFVFSGGLRSPTKETSSSSQGSTGTTIATASNTHIISFSSTDTAVDLSLSCHSANGLPDPSCTPGAIDPTVSQANINSTICVSGYTSTVRPPTSYTTPRKIQSIQQYGYSDTNTSDYEYDHLISLELGGNPKDVRNLWAEPHYGNFTSLDKDGFENYLHRQVCQDLMSLSTAQLQISTDWVSYWIAAGRP